MESPEISRKLLIKEDAFSHSLHSTPTNQKLIKDDFSLYFLHNESSPNFRAGQEVMEIGWGDSPEPIYRETKSTIFPGAKTPNMSKKKLEQKESPISSIVTKKRYIRSALKISQKPQVDISKYVAEVQELSKNIMKELNSNNLKDSKNNHENVSDNQLFQNNNLSKVIGGANDNILVPLNINFNTQTKESSFDKVLQQFINEEDDWLSQVLCTQDVTNFSPKTNFMKSKSENALEPSVIEIRHNDNNSNNFKKKFQRSLSFKTSQPQQKIILSSNNKNTVKDNIKSLSLTSPNGITSKSSTPQYSQKDIEKKRLEAIYRKEKKLIEKKKMEALKRLEMKKLKVIQT